MPLAIAVDGTPSTARAVIFFLHGRGGGLSGGRHLANRLRAAGLPSDVAVVAIEGPFGNVLRHTWGYSAEEQATSRARIRARMRDVLGAGPQQVIVAGFSQGAGVAIDVAVEEPRVTALASLSPCYSFLRGDLPKRANLSVLLVHGARDESCPVEESRSLQRELVAAGATSSSYVEIDGGHVIAPAAVSAIVELAKR
jgi:predicted esterase